MGPPLVFYKTILMPKTRNKTGLVLWIVNWVEAFKCQSAHLTSEEDFLSFRSMKLWDPSPLFTLLSTAELLPLIAITIVLCVRETEFSYPWFPMSKKRKRKKERKKENSFFITFIVLSPWFEGLLGNSKYVFFILVSRIRWGFWLNYDAVAQGFLALK